MKAAVYYENGGPNVFRYEEVADPVLSAAEMLVSVEAISVEGGDTLNRLGGPLTTVPHVVGYQNAGTIVAVGDDVTGFRVGERVVSLAFHGSHAALRVSHPLTTWHIPDGLDTQSAACVPVAYGTAHDSLFEFGRLKEGETVLVHAGAGGVGLAAIQMATRAGARVLATASSTDRLARLEEFGLDHGINYADCDFVTEVRRLTSGKGADVILDSVGGTNLQKSLAALAYRGRCITFGNAGREEPSLSDVSGLVGSNQTLSGYFLGPELFVGSRAYEMIEQLLRDVAAGELKVVIDQRFDLADAEEAHAYIESRRAFGRVLLIP